ncbi:CBS domain-containing protein [Geminocystis sp. CENA526]|uniref:CBS domain-containing protein n=1 Tax=Geminocystis sp. CENA526 TaxID=1355871 RepID=UPI003D6DC3CD
MVSKDLAIAAPLLEDAIDRFPLRVTGDTLLSETLILMSQIQNLRCSLPNFPKVSSDIISSSNISNCVLIMKEQEIEGIFTERDLVRLIAFNSNLEGIMMKEVMTKPVVTLQEENFQDIFAVLFLFRRYKIRHLPIIGDRGQLVGVVSPESLRACLRPSNLLKLRRVSEVINPDVIQGQLTDKVIDLAKLMAEANVSCVVIMEQQPQESSLPVGIITERDLLQFKTLDLDLSKITAQAVMSTPLFLLSPEDSLWTAHQEMERRRVRRLVVSWNWGLGLGLVTQTSLLRVFDPMEMYGVIETLQHTVEELKNNRIEDSPKLINDLEQDKLQVSSLNEKNNSKAKTADTFSSGYLVQAQTELNSRFNGLENKLTLLGNESGMNTIERNKLISLALADVKELKKLLYHR